MTVKYKLLTGVLLVLSVMACQRLVVNSSNSFKDNKVVDPPVLDHEAGDKDRVPVEKLWVPTAIEDCLAKLGGTPAIEPEETFNPYYLRANLDGNSVIDYAVLVHSAQNKQKRGLLICRDSAEPVLLGPLSRSAQPFSTIDDDNFVTNDWEIVSAEEAERAIGPPGAPPKAVKTVKGEAIGFFFEGGNFYVYWDGKAFKGASGA